MATAKPPQGDSLHGDFFSEAWQTLLTSNGQANLDNPQTFSANVDLFYEGETTKRAFLLTSGYAYSCRRLIEGQRCIVDIHVPGDVLGWNNLTFGLSQVEVRTLTAVKVVGISRSQLAKAISHDPRNAFLLFGNLGRAHAVLTEHVINLGRTATARVATLFLEMEARCRRLTDPSRNTFDFPVAQSVLADAIGITPVHLSRVLRSMREANVLSFSDGVVRIIDRQNLQELSDFDPAFIRRLSPAGLHEDVLMRPEDGSGFGSVS